MNIFRTSAFRALALSLALPLSVVLLAGCDVGSTDSTSAVVSDNAGTIYNFAGLYMNPNNATSTNAPLPLVYPATSKSHPSGRAIVSLRLLQYGSTLEAFDSEGLIWSGSISSVQGGVASFSLVGRTTAGQSVDIAGTMVYAAQQSTMDATWIEPNYYGSLFARAIVAPATTNSPVTGLSLTANPTSVSTNQTSTLTASGGTGSYTWECAQTYGSLTGSESTRTYKRTSGTSSNSEEVKVTSGSESKSVTIGFD